MNFTDQVREHSLRVTSFGLFLSFLWWLPGVAANEILWFRRTFLFVAGTSTVVWFLTSGWLPKLKNQYWYLLILIFGFSVASLLKSRYISQGLIGQPSSHPALLSFLAAISLAFLYAAQKKTVGFFRALYWTVTAFGIANLFYWLIFDRAERLGKLGVQANFSAYILVLGLILGIWLMSSMKAKSRYYWVAQSLLMFCVVLTQSRLNLLVAIICFSYMLFYKLQLSRSSKTLLATAFALVLLGGLSLGYFGRLHSLSYFNDSWRYRLDIMRSALPVDGKVHLLGQGVGGIENNIAANGQKFPPIKKDLNNGWHFESSHDYLEDLYVERGPLVLLMYCLIFGAAIKNGLQTKSDQQRLLVWSLLFTVFYLLVNNINIEIETILWICLLGLLSRPVDFSH